MLRRNLLRQFPCVSLFLFCVFPLSLAQNAANLWVSAGGTCTRASTPVAFNASTACGSFAAAYNAASAGDTIYVKAGTYGAQSVPGRSLGTNVVTIMKEPGGAAVNVASISIDSSNVTVDGVVSSDAFDIGHNSGCNSTPGNGWPCAFPVKNVVLRNFSATNGYITGDTVLLQNGSVGPVDGCASGKEDGIQILGLGSGVNPSWTPSDHVTIDNVTVHDVTNSGCNAHVDGIQGFGYRHLIIRNSRIYNTDSSYILAYSFDNSNPLQVDSVLIENNYFGNVPHPGHGITLGNDGSAACGASNLNNIIQNNTFYGDEMADVRCAGSVDAIFRNNISLATGDDCVGDGGNHNFQYDYNIFPSQASSACRSTLHAKTCTPAFADSAHAGGKADLASTDTCAKDAVGGASGTYPTTDVYGTPRPQGPAPDAGAFEYRTTNTQLPSPPTDLQGVVQ